MPVALRRRLVEGQVPPTRERLDGRRRDLALADQVALRSYHHDGDLDTRAGQSIARSVG